MLKCDHCSQEFKESIDGFIEKTFHEILHEQNINNVKRFELFEDLEILEIDLVDE